MTLAREGLDWLLARHPGMVPARVDAQPLAETTEATLGMEGPWVLVDFSGAERFAIWKATGSVYRVGEHGAVDDDPVFAPSGGPGKVAHGVRTDQGDAPTVDR